MSTYYRELREPWSSIRVDDDKRHSHIHLWQDGGKAGELCVDADKRDDVLRQFFEDEDVCQRYFGGVGVGCRLNVFRVPRTSFLLSEYSELVSWNTLSELPAGEFDCRDGESVEAVE